MLRNAEPVDLQEIGTNASKEMSKETASLCIRVSWGI